MFTNSSGYTLVEILVATLLILVITGSGVAAYRNFDDRQKLTNAGREMANVLRNAQKKSQAGEKPDMGACQTHSLQGWRIWRNSTTSYSVAAICNNSVVDSRSYDLSKYETTLPNAFTIQFNVLTGRPSQNVTLNLSKAPSRIYRIQVTRAGGVSDIGID